MAALRVELELAQGLVEPHKCLSAWHLSADRFDINKLVFLVVGDGNHCCSSKTWRVQHGHQLNCSELHVLYVMRSF